MADDPRPPRVTLTAVETGDYITAQFNPEEVSEKIQVLYSELEVMGLSHRPQQYQGTSNTVLAFELGFDRLSVDGGDKIDRAKNFLRSLCYPRRAAQDVLGGGPSRVLLSWPNLYSLTCRVWTLDLNFKKFNSTMRDTLFTCKMEIREARDVRLYAEDVLSQGTLRS